MTSKGVCLARRSLISLKLTVSLYSVVPMVIKEIEQRKGSKCLQSKSQQNAFVYLSKLKFIFKKSAIPNSTSGTRCNYVDACTYF